MAARKKIYRMSDELLGRVLNVIQEAMISGTDVLDLFREMEMKPSDDDPHHLVLTDDYRAKIDAWHKDIEDILKKREQEFTEQHGGLIVGTGDASAPSEGLYLVSPDDIKKIN